MKNGLMGLIILENTYFIPKLCVCMPRASILTPCQKTFFIFLPHPELPDARPEHYLPCIATPVDKIHRRLNSLFQPHFRMAFITL